MFVGIIFVLVVQIDESVTGTAVVRARRKMYAVATFPARVRSIEVSSGDRVRRGDPVANVDYVSGTRTPAGWDDLVRSPIDGMVSEIVTHAGVQLNPGDQVASVIDADAGYEMISMLPASHAPQILRGMPVVLRLDGYPRSGVIGSIDQISMGVLSAREAAKYVSREGIDLPQVSGPVVVVKALLNPSTFGVDGRKYAYRDGMTGQAEVRTRSDSMILSLMPGLKSVLRR
jgi:acetyl/propionyl-CoA carboxylase alpha subunit